MSGKKQNDGEQEEQPTNENQPSRDITIEMNDGTLVRGPSRDQRSDSSSSAGGAGPRYRVVELLQGEESQPNQWSISRQFYDIDVTVEPENDDEDDGADDDDGQFVEDDYYSDDYYSNQDGIEEFNMAVDDQDGDQLEQLRRDIDGQEGDDDSEIYEDDEFDPGNEMELIEPHEDEQLSNESGDDESDANYDTTLPVGHHYLGDDLEESRRREVLVEGSVIKLPLINLRHVVLFPNQVLPVLTSNLSPLIGRCIRMCVRRGITTIGLMSDSMNNHIGTTAEIRNFTFLEDGECRLIMEGRQRFRLLSAPFDTARESGEVKILYEVTLGTPFPRTASLLRYSNSTSTLDKYTVSKHPKWVLKRYDARNIILRIMEQIKDWCNPDSTKNANDFSYWVASNLPISNKERLKALSFDCTESRLLWLLKRLESSNCFCCSSCNNVICHTEDVFPMSRSGPQCSFVNTGGFIHDTLTVKSASGLLLEYGWSKEFSWFPGYAWRSAYCQHCNKHIGWCYKSVEVETKPRRFYGLSRLNVKLSTEGSELISLPQQFQVM